MVASLVERGLQWLQHVGSVAGVLGLRVWAQLFGTQV